MPRIEYRNAAGEKVPGVTTVIGQNLGWKAPGLIHWAWKLGIEGKDYKAERQKAADAGTLAHAWSEADIHGTPLPPPPAEMDVEGVQRAEAGLTAFRSWRNTSRFELRHAEIPLISETHQFGGCIDVVGLLDNRWALLDLKASKAVYEDHLIQIAAYGVLWNENNPGAEIASYHLLRLGPEGDFHHSAFGDLSEEWNAFVHLLELHRIKKRISRKAA